MFAALWFTAFPPSKSAEAFWLANLIIGGRA